MKNVLFVCTENAARSQMAQALLRHYAGAQFAVASAGTAPSQVDPRTLTALEAFNVDAGGLFSKSIASLGEQHFDYIISLCDSAQFECRNWPHAGVALHWDFSDPKASPAPDAFAQTLQQLSERIQHFVSVHSTHVEGQFKAPDTLTFYKALADETRLLSLLLIAREDELCVCELTEALDLSQPKISRHLSGLRKQGLLLDRRHGQWVFYRLHPLLSDWMRQMIYTTAEHSQAMTAAPLARLTQMKARPMRDANACT
ncbi:MAG: metalloregulator ArsR/SmtB family transcription factor [Pseudomonadales bacterium]